MAKWATRMQNANNKQQTTNNKQQTATKLFNDNQLVEARRTSCRHLLGSSQWKRFINSAIKLMTVPATALTVMGRTPVCGESQRRSHRNCRPHTKLAKVDTGSTTSTANSKQQTANANATANGARSSVGLLALAHMINLDSSAVLAEVDTCIREPKWLAWWNVRDCLMGRQMGSGSLCNSCNWMNQADVLPVAHCPLLTAYCHCIFKSLLLLLFAMFMVAMAAASRSKPVFAYLKNSTQVR